MIELFQSMTSFIWQGIILIIPMPWRFATILLLTLFILPWILLRGLPITISYSSKILLRLAVSLFNGLFQIEGLITQKIRRKNSNIPPIIYILGDLITELLSVCDKFVALLDKLIKNITTYRWSMPKKIYVLLFILLVVLCSIRSFLGKKSSNELILIGSIVGNWHKFENRIVTGKDSSSNLSILPEEFIRDYYYLINSSQYQIAWNYLSPGFKSNKNIMKKGYIDYVEHWQKYERVSVNQVNLIQKSKYSALVDIELQYYKENTGKQFAVERIRYPLIWDKKNSSWLIEKR
jgi:hypothetical protein